MDAVVLVIISLAIVIAVIVNKKASNTGTSNFSHSFHYNKYGVDKPDITKLGINEIKECGKFSPQERAAEYRRRGKSPSGVIDGVYNDSYRGNGEYNDSYRDWDADA